MSALLMHPFGIIAIHPTKRPHPSIIGNYFKTNIMAFILTIISETTSPIFIRTLIRSKFRHVISIQPKENLSKYHKVCHCKIIFMKPNRTTPEVFNTVVSAHLWTPWIQYPSASAVIVHIHNCKSLQLKPTKWEISQILHTVQLNIYNILYTSTND